MKCEICGKNIGTTFMNKIVGAYIKDSKGKRHAICFECQKKFSNDKTKIAEKLNISIK